jgi:adhesin transport system membrane fusion protein
MSWFSQARIFFSEVRAMKATDKENPPEKVNKDDLEFVSSASEARLLAVPQGASFLIFLAVLATGALIAWASVMEVDEIAKAEGKVIPSKQVQVIQNLEGGIVKEINVVEGQTVQKGDVLVIIDDVYAKSDVDSNVDSYNALLARFVALNTLISGKRIITFPNELKSYIQIMSQERQRFDTEWHEITAQIKEL